jgi:hypothetical protein
MRMLTSVGVPPSISGNTDLLGLIFDNAITNVMSVFWVLGSQEGGGFLLGCYDPDNSSICDFHRGPRVNNSLNPVTTENRLYGYNAPSRVTAGKTYVDEVLIPSPGGTAATNILNGGYQLIETHCTDNTRADGLAMDRAFTDRRGGQRLAELLIFSRSVTEGERTLLDAYLNWKWFGRTTPHSLFMPPDGAVADTVRVATGATLELGGFTQDTRALVGGGTIGGGNLSVTGLVDLSDPDAGTLSVNGDLTLADGVTVQVGPGNTVDVNGMLTINGSGLIEWPDVSPAVGSTAIFTYDTLAGANNLALWDSEDPAVSHYSVHVYANEGTVYVSVSPKGTLIIIR